MTETYTSDFQCMNCKWAGKLDIPKGTTTSVFRKDKDCPNCGTKKLI